MNYLEDIIRNAQERGEFDNLPGAGKPLKIEDNPYAGDSQMAHSLVKQAGYTLEFIEERKQVIAAIDVTRKELHKAAKQFTNNPWSRLRWRNAESEFRHKAERLNKVIRNYNLKAPLDQFQVIPLDIDLEIAKVNPTK